MNIDLKKSEIWFLTGSQSLYGPETLERVAEHSIYIASALDADEAIPFTIVHKPVLTDPEGIYSCIEEANQNKNCIGIITWMHTFSPAKMWIGGLRILRKPMLHLHTQYNRDIPWTEINMDFMNLNQSAHGDREFGFIVSRLRNIPRKTVAGHWEDAALRKEIGDWGRTAAAWQDWQGAKFARFGDNMRYVAVTEGDKVEAEYKFGYSVNTYGIGDLVKVINEVSDAEVDALLNIYEDQYHVSPELLKGGARNKSLRDAARIEKGMQHFLEDGNFKGFTDTFEDLYGMAQLPGIAVQRLMAAGYGFAGEGDWKTAALVRAMKVMGTGLPGGNSFMEDYTYHFEPGNEMVLGSHMLEICESISDGKPSCQVHQLGIGGKEDPVRLVFNVAAGPALNASIIDMGNRFRLLVNTVEAVVPTHEMPKLPTARVLWQAQPNMKDALTAWILAGGAHHTCYSQNVSAQQLEDFAAIAGIECVVIDKNTRIGQFKKELLWNDKSYC